MTGKEVVKKVLAVVDEQALVAMLVTDLVKPAVMEFVEDTANPYDNKLAEALMPKIEKDLPVLLAKLVAKLEA